MNKMKYFILVLILSLIIPSVLCFALEQEQNIDELYKKKLEYKKEVYEKTLKFLEENPDAPNAARLYFNLAEMSGEIDIDNPAKTAAFYKKVLEKDPNFPSKDVVLYNLGFYSFEAAKKRIYQGRNRNKNLMINWPDSLRLSEDMPEVKRAIGAFKIIVNYYPDSQYHSEAIYRLGAIYFEIALDARNPMKYYDKAIKYFDVLANKAGDPLKNHAIFQRGWTYFTSGKYDLAIKDFTKILQFIKQDTLSKQKTYFEDDAIENIAYSLIEFDGTNFTQYSKAAIKLKEIFSNFVSEEYAKEIILNAIKLKLKYYAPMQAIDLYNSLIALFPTNIDNPCYNDSIISIYKRYPKRTRNNKDPKKLIVQEYIRITKDYSYNSEWFKANKDKDISKQLDIIFYAYNFIEKRYYNNFAKNQTIENYEKYRKLVEDYILLADITGKNLSDKHKVVRQRLIEAALNLAAKTRKPEYYFTAISNIKSYIATYKHDDKYFEYNRNLFLITENLYEVLKDSVKAGTYIDTTINVVLDSLSLDSLLIVASIEYEKVLNDSLNSISEKGKNKELARIILLRANLYRKDSNIEKAIEDYKKILTLKDVDKQIRQDVLSTLAYIYQEQGDFAEAENYYRQAVAISSQKQKADLENNILATIKSAAEANLERGDYEKSAQEFLRLASELKDKDPKQSVGYTVKAIEVYKKAGEYQKAIDLFVKIADSKKDKLDVLAALKGAWTISDSLLNDLNQTISLKEKFIAKYPSSNEAYILRLQLIKLYDDGPLADKEKAAEMYLSLFNDAYNKKIDIGEDKLEDIYLNALRIYEELNNDDKIIEHTYKFVSLFPKSEIKDKLLTKVAIILDKRSDVEGMLAFEKKFPNHHSSIDLLKRVAFIYKSRGEESKYEDIARYIHKKDPSIDLLTEVAAQKLKILKTEIDSLFNDKNYDQMFAKIDEFKKIDQKYRKDDIKLDLKPVYERFDYYKKYIDFHKKYSEFLTKIDEQILNKTPGLLIKVNKLTTWKRHLNGGKKRIKALMNKNKTIEKKFLKLVKEGKEYGITDEEIMQGLLKIGKMYDYSTDVVIKQINKYIDISNELNSDMWKNNPLLQKQTKDKIRLIAKKYSIEFLKNAIKYYGNIYTIYKKNKGFDNDITAYVEDRLKELGYLKDKVYEHYYTDATWRINKSKINNYMIDKDIDSLWTNAKLNGNTVFEQNVSVIQLPLYITSYLTKNIHFDIAPDLLEIKYLHNQPIKIYVNGVLSELKPTSIDTIQISNKEFTIYKQKVINGLSEGNNAILMKIPADLENNLFAADITVQYDKEKLEYYRTTTTDLLNTDFTWRSKKNVSDITAVQSLSSWDIVSKGSLQYFKPQLYGLEDSKALAIWSADLDTTKVQTRYFAKDLYIPSKVIKATAKIAAQEISSLYVNGTMIYKDKKLLFDKALKQALPINVEIPLTKGNNIIIIKVKGGIRFKGLLAQITYTYKKSDTSEYQQEDTQKNENIDTNNKVSTNDSEEKVKEEQATKITENETKTNEIDEKKTVQEEKTDNANQGKQEEQVNKTDQVELNKAVSDSINFENLLLSDYAWFTLKGNFDYVIPEEDTLWTLVGKPFESIENAILDNFKKDAAQVIWYPENTKSDSENVYFIKSFENNTNNNVGIIKIYASYPVSVWVNNELIVENLDCTQEAKEVKVENLIKGNNTVFIKLNKQKTAEKEFFIFEMKY